MNNYFQLFQLEPRYQLDLQELNKRYVQLQTQCHPDKFVNASKQEQELAQRMSSQCNQAFRQLHDPIGRVKHLLTIYGIAGKEQVSPDLLMEQMQLHEQLDTATEQEQLDRIQRIIENELATIDTALVNQFDHQDTPDETAAVLLQRLQFYNRLRTTIKSRGAS